MEREDTTLYTALGIDTTSVDVLSLSDRDITRAYRKAALKHHPDKNRSDPSSAEKFSAIFLAYETLHSPEQRAKYDTAIRAVRLQKQRFQQLDDNRRRMKLDLDRREREAMEGIRKRKRDMDDETLKRMQREIERLRKEVMRNEARRDDTRNERKDQRRDKTQIFSSGADPWASVEGYEDFRSGVGTAAQFAEFEEAVLTGRKW